LPLPHKARKFMKTNKSFALGKMNQINTIATAVTKINQHKVDDAICRFIGRHWKGFLMGFYVGDMEHDYEVGDGIA